MVKKELNPEGSRDHDPDRSLAGVLSPLVQHFTLCD